MQIAILIDTLNSTVCVSGDKLKKSTSSVLGQCIELSILDKNVCTIEINKFRLKFFKCRDGIKFYKLVIR